MSIENHSFRPLPSPYFSQTTVTGMRPVEGGNQWADGATFAANNCNIGRTATPYPGLVISEDTGGIDAKKIEEANSYLIALQALKAQQSI
jgi:hypothetical protein